MNSRRHSTNARSRRSARRDLRSRRRTDTRSRRSRCRPPGSVVGARRLEGLEAGLFDFGEEQVPPRLIALAQIHVVVIGQGQRGDGGFLKRVRRAHGDEVVGPADAHRELGARHGVADPPARDRVRLRDAGDGDGPLRHAGQGRDGDVGRPVVDDVLVDLVRDGEEVVLDADVGDGLELSLGKVLVIGGSTGAIAAGCEIYDSLTGMWSPASSMSKPRKQHTATLLPNGSVLVTGGQGMYAPGLISQTASCEIYNPVSNTWTPTGPLSLERIFHSANLLSNGTVLVSGGYNNIGTTFYSSCEIFDPYTGLWTRAAPMSIPHYQHKTVVLDSTKLLVISGRTDLSLSSISKACEVFTYAAPNQPPTIVTNPSAVPSPVTGKASAFSEHKVKLYRFYKLILMVI